MTIREQKLLLKLTSAWLLAAALLFAGFAIADGQMVPAFIVKQPVIRTNYLWLNWVQSPSLDVAANNIYSGTQPGIYTNVYHTSTPLTMLPITIIGNARHFYAVTAVDTNGQESPFSNEAHWPKYQPQFLGTVTLDWGINLMATIQTTTNFFTWIDRTNLVGSSVSLPCSSPSDNFRVVDDFGMSGWQGFSTTIRPDYFYQE